MGTDTSRLEEMLESHKRIYRGAITELESIFRESERSGGPPDVYPVPNPTFKQNPKPGEEIWLCDDYECDVCDGKHKLCVIFDTSLRFLVFRVCEDCLKRANNMIQNSN